MARLARPRSSPVSAMCRRSTLSAKPTAGSGRPNDAQQLVVAAAAAERHAVGGVIDLKQRPGVVAEAAHQPQVEDDPLGHLGRQQAVDLAHAAERVVQRPLQPLQHLGAAAGVREAQQQVGVGLGQAQRADLPLDADEVAGGQLGEDQVAALGVHLEGLEQRRVQRGVAEPDAVAVQAGGVQRRAQHAEHLGGAGRARARRSARRRPAGTRGSGRAAGARRGRRGRRSRSAAAARRGRSGSRPPGRWAPSCRAAARARCRARRTPGRRGRAPPMLPRSKVCSYSSAGV